jgi:hypothetical protein
MRGGIERDASVCGEMSFGLDVSLRRHLRKLYEHMNISSSTKLGFQIRTGYLRGADRRWIPTAWRNELESCSRRAHSATR